MFRSFGKIAALVSVLFATVVSVPPKRFLQHDKLEIKARKKDEDCSIDHIPFYILNLNRRRSDKLAGVEEAIDRDVPWMCDQTCRVDAPDGSSWGPYLNDHIASHDKWQKIKNGDRYEHITFGKLTPGAIALIAGHGRMWEHVLQDKAELAVLMEDDLTYFHPHIKSFLCWIADSPGLQAGWDFLQLQSHNFSLIPDEMLMVHREGHVYNTGMYLIKLESARKALKGLFPLHNPVQLDSPDSDFWTKLKGAYSVPSAAQASHSVTDVQQVFEDEEDEWFLQRSAKAPKAPKCKIRDCKKLNISQMVVPSLEYPTDQIADWAKIFPM